MQKKIISLYFYFDTQGETVTQTKTMPNGYTNIESFKFVQQNSYISPATIESFSIDNDTSYIEQGVDVGLFQIADSLCHLDKTTSNQAEIKVTLKDTSNPLDSAYGIRLHFLISKP